MDGPTIFLMVWGIFAVVCLTWMYRYLNGVREEVRKSNEIQTPVESSRIGKKYRFGDDPFKPYDVIVILDEKDGYVQYAWLLDDGQPSQIKYSMKVSHLRIFKEIR